MATIDKLYCHESLLEMGVNLVGDASQMPRTFARGGLLGCWASLWDDGFPQHPTRALLAFLVFFFMSMLGCGMLVYPSILHDESPRVRESESERA